MQDLDSELIFEQYLIKEEPMSSEFDELGDEDSDDESDFSRYFHGKKPSTGLGYKLYKGRRVEWVGKIGMTLKVNSEDISSREDNITDPKKVQAVKNHILKSESRVRFDTPPADIRIIDLDTIRETQEAFARDALQLEYRIGEPFTTGDDDVDKYLYLDIDEFAEYVGLDSDFVDGDGNPIMDEILEYNDQEEAESIRDEIIETFYDIRNRLDDCIKEKSGDIGRIWAVLRDANHRTWGAILAGEPYIYVYPHHYNKRDIEHIKDQLI